MSLKRIISDFQQVSSFPVLVDDVAAWLKLNGFQDEINFIESDFCTDKAKGLLLRYTNRPGVYADPHFVSNIYFHKDLNECWKRLVCCKELLHIIDDESCRTATKDAVEKLTFNLALPSSDDTDDIIADRVGYIYALMVLAPLNAIEKLRQHYQNKTKSAYTIALYFRIPQMYVDFLFSPDYKRIFEKVISSPPH